MTSTFFNRTNIIHMTTSVSGRLNILCIMFTIRAVPRIYICFTHTWKMFTCPHYFTKREGLGPQTSLTPPVFIDMPVPSM